MKYIIVFITASSKKEAKTIAEGLVDSGVAACVNIVSKIQSVFMWEGKKEIAEEHLLIAKTGRNKFPKLKQQVKRFHSYTVPEIIAAPIIEGEERYLSWISEVVGAASRPRKK